LCGCSFLAKHADAHERGIYAFGWGANFLETPVFARKDISGMTAYFAWRDLEPEEGIYDFSAIDHLVSKAGARGKKLNIGIYPGSFSPPWIYEKNISGFSWYWKYKEDRWKSSGVAGEWKKSPYPWDEVYLKHWKMLISHLAAVYRDNDAVGYISLTGPTIETLTTATVLENDEDWKRFSENGYSIERLYKAWCDVIEHYHRAFQGKKSLVLALGPERPRSANTELASRVAKYVIDHHYKEIAFMSVFLNDTWFLRGGGALGIRKVLKNAKAAGYVFGYQMAGPARTASKWQRDFQVIKSLRKSLEIGIGDGASWIEVWHADLFTKNSDGVFVTYEVNSTDVGYAAKVLLEGY